MRNPLNGGFFYGIFSLIYNNIVDMLFGGGKMNPNFTEMISLIEKRKSNAY